MRDSVHEQIIVDTNMTTQSPNTPKRRTYSAEFKERLVQEPQFGISHIVTH